MSAKIEFSLESLENLCKLCPTYEEVATFFGCSKQTIINRRNQEPDFKEAMDRGYDGGKMALRRWQMQAAEKGSAAMLIFLGKNLLGQKDQVDQVVTGNVTQSFTLKPPHEYRLPSPSAVPETIEGDFSRETLRDDRGDNEIGKDVRGAGLVN